MSAAGRKREPARCKDCRAPVVWKVSITGQWRTFDPRPVDSMTHVGPMAYPTEASRYYRTRELIEELMVRQRVGEAEATEDTYAHTWLVAHTCVERNDHDSEGAID